MRLKAFDDYHHGTPKIDTLTYKIVPDSNALMAQLETGDVNYIGVASEHVELATELKEKGSNRTPIN